MSHINSSKHQMPNTEDGAVINVRPIKITLQVMLCQLPHAYTIDSNWLKGNCWIRIQVTIWILIAAWKASIPEDEHWTCTRYTLHSYTVHFKREEKKMRAHTQIFQKENSNNNILIEVVAKILEIQENSDKKMKVEEAAANDRAKWKREALTILHAIYSYVTCT